MTISTAARRAGAYQGTGAEVDFPFAFRIFTPQDVAVTTADTAGRETVLPATAYSVSPNADQGTHPGGNVRLHTPLAAGHRLTITGALAIEQPVEFTNQGGFYPRVLNDCLDRLTIYCQQLEEKLSRAMLGAVNTGTPPNLPAAGAGHFLVWGADGALSNHDLEGRLESSDTAGGAGRIATAEAVKKVSEKLATDKEALKKTIDENKQAAIARADTDKSELSASIAAAKQEITDLRQAVNAMTGGSAALDLVDRLAAAEAGVAALGKKVDDTVASLTQAVNDTANQMRQETQNSLKRLKTLALAGL